MKDPYTHFSSYPWFHCQTIPSQVLLHLVQQCNFHKYLLFTVFFFTCLHLHAILHPPFHGSHLSHSQMYSLCKVCYFLIFCVQLSIWLLLLLFLSFLTLSQSIQNVDTQKSYPAFRNGDDFKCKHCESRFYIQKCFGHKLKQKTFKQTVFFWHLIYIQACKSSY